MNVERDILNILKNTDSSVILTEVDNELLFQDASVREEYEALKKYKEEHQKEFED